MRIMFEDLTFEAQMRLLAEAGVDTPGEMGWHISPLAIVETEKKPFNWEEGFTDEDADSDNGGSLY
jgi:hypothetical protein